jgi:ABC-type antimicrobial peptide transport system permease subunit
MILNYLKIAFRNLLRYRTYTIINILGLTLGIAAALFIYLIVRYELSYDTYHSRANRIYRINQGAPGSDSPDTGTNHLVAELLRNEVSEVEEAGVVFKLNPDQTQMQIGEEMFREPETYLVEPNAFKLLDFEWKAGDPTTALDEPNEVVIAASIAQKYFRGDAIGKVIRFNNNVDLVVTGIISDHPLNTDIPIRIAISHALYLTSNKNELPTTLDGGSNSYYQTFALLREGVDPLQFQERLNQLVEKHLGKEKAEKHYALIPQPLTDIHFNVGNFHQRITSTDTIFALRLIGVFILIIACINFINMASAQAVKRSREVGIRKTLGGKRQHLVFQFLGETFLLTLGALVLAYAIAGQLVGASKALTDIPLNADVMLQPELFVFMVFVLFAVTILSGFYPAFVLSGFQPASALRNKVTVSGLSLRKGLITFQFLISQVLIVCAFFVVKQNEYFSTGPLGFDKEAILTFDLPSAEASKLSVLRNNLLTRPEITDVTFSLNTPSATINKWWAGLIHPSLKNDTGVEVKFMDSTYLRMFDIEVIAGTGYVPYGKSDKVVVNETLVKTIGITDVENAIGQTFNYWGQRATIVGVVRDFQTVNLRQGMHPVLLTNNGYYAKGSAKVDMRHADEAIVSLEKYWKATFPGNFFTYAFLEDDLETFYKEEKKLSRLLTVFAGIAVSIGCIGLFGLITFTTVQRAKEIGIRKVLGATVSNLTGLLSKEFVLLVSVAVVLASPIAWYAMDQWLNRFVNHIPIAEYSWIFFVAGGIAVSLALVTVCLQAIKAAFANPVDSLRAE